MRMLLAVLFVALSCGCISLNGAEAIALRDVARGAFSAITEPQQTALKSQKDWDDFWARHSAGSIGSKKPEVDLSKEMVLAVTIGRRNTGGYSITVEKAESRGDKFVVSYSERSPKPGGMTLQALSAPFHFVAVPRTDKTVTFQKIAPLPKPQ